MKHQVLGFLRPTAGNAVGLTARFSGRYPINMALIRQLRSDHGLGLSHLHAFKSSSIIVFLLVCFVKELQPQLRRV